LELRRRPERHTDERRSRFAVSAFVTDYTNLQVQTPIQPGVCDRYIAVAVGGITGDVSGNR
jgi:hypothetical protein